MKLIASICSLLLVGAVSVWLLFTQGPSDVVADGADVGTTDTAVDLESATSPDVVAAQESGSPLITDEHAAAFVGLQAAFDVWRVQPSSVLSDPDLLAGALAQARDSVADAADEQERVAQANRAAEEQAQRDREAARQQEQESARTVVPQPVSPPDYDDDWDDDGGDDDWDDDDGDDDWDDDDGDDDDEWDD